MIDLFYKIEYQTVSPWETWSDNFFFGTVIITLDFDHLKTCQYVPRRTGEAYQPDCLNPIIKHGGDSLQLRGCLSSSGVGDLIKIEGRLTGERYVDILRHHAVSSGMRLIGHNFILLQDNNPKNCARVAKNYLNEMAEEGVLELMALPPPPPLPESRFEYN